MYRTTASYLAAVFSFILTYPSMVWATTIEETAEFPQIGKSGFPLSTEVELVRLGYNVNFSPTQYQIDTQTAYTEMYQGVANHLNKAMLGLYESLCEGTLENAEELISPYIKDIIPERGTLEGQDIKNQIHVIWYYLSCKNFLEREIKNNYEEENFFATLNEYLSYLRAPNDRTYRVGYGTQYGVTESLYYMMGYEHPRVLSNREVIYPKITPEDVLNGYVSIKIKLERHFSFEQLNWLFPKIFGKQYLSLPVPIETLGDSMFLNFFDEIHTFKKNTMVSSGGIKISPINNHLGLAIYNVPAIHPYHPEHMSSEVSPYMLVAGRGSFKDFNEVLPPVFKQKILDLDSPCDYFVTFQSCSWNPKKDLFFMPQYWMFPEFTFQDDNNPKEMASGMLWWEKLRDDRVLCFDRTEISAFKKNNLFLPELPKRGLEFCTTKDILDTPLWSFITAGPETDKERSAVTLTFMLRESQQRHLQDLLPNPTSEDIYIVEASSLMEVYEILWNCEDFIGFSDTFFNLYHSEIMNE